MNAKEIEIKLPELTLAAKVWGEKEQPTVLAFHGWLDNAASFDLIAPHLSGVRLVCVDFPGHGLSDHKPGVANYWFLDWVEIITSTADALGLETFSLLGHSMGAGASSLTAGTFPKRVDSLVLIEGLGPLVGAPEEVPDRLAKNIIEIDRLRRRKTKRYKSVEEAVRVRSVVETVESPEGLEAIVRRGLKKVEGGYCWSEDPCLRLPSPLRITIEQSKAFLLRIECPVLLLMGENGLLPQFLPNLDELHEVVKDLSIAKTPGGHHPHLDDPKALAQPVLEFWKGIQALKI